MFKLSLRDTSSHNSHCNSRGIYLQEKMLLISFWVTSSKVIWKKMENQTDLLGAGLCEFHTEIQMIYFVTTAKEPPFCKL